MIYDLNAQLSRRREDRSRELKEQIGRLDEQIGALELQQAEAGAAQEALKQIEAVLLRMSMLAREAAAGGGRREGLLEEFEECRRRIGELSEGAELFGFNLVKNRADVVRSVIEALIERL